MPDGVVARPTNPSSWLVTLADAHTGQRVAASQIPLPPPTATAMLTPQNSEWPAVKKEGKEKSGIGPWNNWFYVEMTKIRPMPQTDKADSS